MNEKYTQEWNSDLDGYVIKFCDGKIAHTQTYVEGNRLHADHGETYLERYTEYDDELSNEQEEAVYAFIEKANHHKSETGKWI